MPDVREVFDMSTQKIRPEAGFVDRQHDHQNARDRNRKIGAFVVVGALGLATVLLILTTRPVEDASTPANVSGTTTPQTVPPGFTARIIHLATGTDSSLPKALSGGLTYVASPDGTKIAFGTCCTSQDEIRIGNLDGSDVHQVTPTRLDAYGPMWSPDGAQLAYQLRDADTGRFGSVVVQDVATGDETILATLEGTNNWWYLSPSFSPDGQNVIFHQPRTTSPGWDVWTVPVTGGNPTMLLKNAGFPRYFPDGREIVFVAGMTQDLSGRRIMVADAEGTRRRLVTGEMSASWPTISPDGTRVAYVDGPSIHVVNVATGESTKVGVGSSAEWLDNDTLIVAP